jgi:hypothetical protein
MAGARTSYHHESVYFRSFSKNMQSPNQVGRMDSTTTIFIVPSAAAGSNAVWEVLEHTDFISSPSAHPMISMRLSTID